MLDFTVETIPHKNQRYPTVGDYLTDVFGRKRFRISELSRWQYELLVAIHEILESYMAEDAGITEPAIDYFDMQYEDARKPGDNSEPGDDPNCPVYRQHQIATRIERFIARELGVDWNKYEAEIDSLP